MIGRATDRPRLPRPPPGRPVPAPAGPVRDAATSPCSRSGRRRPHAAVDWSFTVRGAVAREVAWTWEELLALPRETLTVDIHCVTQWTKLDTTWTGVSIDTLLGPPAALDGAGFAVAHAADGYETNLPLADLTGGRAWLVWEYEGAPLAAAARRPGAAAGPASVLLEEREVGARAGAARRGPARLLGGQRLPRPRGPMAGAAVSGGLNWRTVTVTGGAVRRRRACGRSCSTCPAGRATAPGQSVDVRLTAADGYSTAAAVLDRDARPRTTRSSSASSTSTRARCRRGWRASCARATSSSCAGPAGARSPGTPTRAGRCCWSAAARGSCRCGRWSATRSRPARTDVTVVLSARTRASLLFADEVATWPQQACAHVTYTREGGQRLDAATARRRRAGAARLRVRADGVRRAHHDAAARGRPRRRSRSRRALRWSVTEDLHAARRRRRPVPERGEGLLGGHARTRVYGTMDCPVALSLLRRGFQPRHRVFFADEATAIAAGFRPVRRVPAREVPRVEGRRGPLGGPCDGPRRAIVRRARRAAPSSAAAARPCSPPPRAAFVLGVAFGCGAARSDAGRAPPRRAPGDRGAARRRRARPHAHRDPGPRRRAQPPAAGRQARRAALRGHDGADLRAPACCARLGLGRDPVQAPTSPRPEQLRALTAALRDVRQGRRRDADRLHRPGGRRDPQRRLGAARRSAGRAGARRATPRPPRRRCARPASTSRSRRSPTSRRARHRARRPRVLARPERAAARPPRPRSSGWLRGRRRADRQALPRPRRRDRQHRLRLGHDRRRRADGRRPGAVQGRDRGQGAADHELARRLPAARRAPHRLAVAGDPQGPAARAARLPRRRDHGLDRGQGRARHRRRPRRSPCARSARATTSCSPPARARGSGPTARCSPRPAHRASFRALVRASAPRVLVLQQRAALAHPSAPKWRLKQDSRAKSSRDRLRADEGRAPAPAAARQRPGDLACARMAHARPGRDGGSPAHHRRRSSSSCTARTSGRCRGRSCSRFAGVIIFRGGVDVIAHKLIPAPALYGAEDALKEQDVMSRRRVWYWRHKFKVWWCLGLIVADRARRASRSSRTTSLVDAWRRSLDGLAPEHALHRSAPAAR